MRSQSTGLLVVASLIAVAALPGSAAAQRRPGYPSGGYQYRFAGPESHLRLAITPREASVYIDGYFAGHVDDYDGALQRLHVEPGPHEIIIYLKGHRSMREKRYLSPNATRTLAGKLEPLAAGEPDEAVPTPVAPPAAPSEGTAPATNAPAL